MFSDGYAGGALVSLDAVVSNSPLAIHAVTLDGTVTLWNPACEALLGWASEEVMGQPFPAGAEDDLTRIRDEVAAGAVLVDVEVRHRRRDGRLVELNLTAAPLRAADGTVGAMVAMARETGPRRRLEQLLAGEAAVLEQIARGGPLAGSLDTIARLHDQLTASRAMILVADPGGRMLRVGAAPNVDPSVARASDGLPARPESGPSGLATARGHPVVLADVAASALADDRRRRLLGAGVAGLWATPIRSAADGAVLGAFEVHMSAARGPTPDEEDLVGRLCTLAAVAIEHERSSMRLTRQALHDPLTGLPNRALLLDRLEVALANAPRRRRRVAVLSVGLDRFTFINDNLGHEGGDRLLVALAARLQAAVGAGSTLARLGGDEFAVLCEDVASAPDAADLATALLEALRPPFVVDTEEVFVTASVGIAVARGDQDPAATLMRDAHTARHRAKSLGGGRWELFDEAMRSRSVATLTRESHLHRAVDRDEFVVHYQPEVSLATGEIVAAEALVRWQHPVDGLLQPIEFVGLAEETGLVVQMGHSVLRQACEQAAAWAGQLGARAPVVWVNVSARQLADPAFATAVSTIAGAAGAPLDHLGLEITESVLVEDVASTAPALQTLRGLGVRLGIDDFGTGYASLSYLKRLPVDVLKIDRSFVERVVDDHIDAAIVSSVAGMAHALGLLVVAEGVETAEQAETLTRLGCDIAQGFLYARPAPPAQLAGLLATGAAR